MERPEGMRAEPSYSQRGSRGRESESPSAPKTLMPIMCTLLGFMRVTGLQRRAADVRVYSILCRNKEEDVPIPMPETTRCKINVKQRQQLVVWPIAARCMISNVMF